MRGEIIVNFGPLRKRDNAIDGFALQAFDRGKLAGDAEKALVGSPKWATSFLKLTQPNPLTRVKASHGASDLHRMLSSRSFRRKIYEALNHIQSALCQPRRR